MKLKTLFWRMYYWVFTKEFKGMTLKDVLDIEEI
jgi:hypothetical protein